MENVSFAPRAALRVQVYSGPKARAEHRGVLVEQRVAPAQPETADVILQVLSRKDDNTPSSL